MSALPPNGPEKRAIQSLIHGAARPRPASRIYQPLPPDSIRLLELKPARDDDDDGAAQAITLDLTTVALQDAARSYDVLSFDWGDASEDDQVIVLNDVAVRVTTSLADALRKYRHGSKGRTFWIDALCVDQTDVVDRSLAVGLMLRIYTRANEVIMWSGKEGDASTAMCFLRAKANAEIAKQKRLLRGPLDVLPVVVCGEKEEWLGSFLGGLPGRVFGLGGRSRGGLLKRSEGLVEEVDASVD